MDIGRIAASDICRDFDLREVDALVFEVVIGGRSGLDHRSPVFLLLPSCTKSAPLREGYR